MACGHRAARPRLHAACVSKISTKTSARAQTFRAAACFHRVHCSRFPSPHSASLLAGCAMMAANAASLASLTPCNQSLDGHVPCLSTYAISPSGPRCRRSSPKAPARTAATASYHLQPALEAWRPAQSEACNQWCQDKGCWCMISHRSVSTGLDRLFCTKRLLTVQEAACRKEQKEISAEFSVYVICSYVLISMLPLACAWRCPQVRMRTRCRWTSAGVMA
jgi:hypothetical protein